MTVGNNSRTYADNFVEHGRLLAEAGALNGSLGKARGELDAATAELEAQRAGLSVDEVRAREDAIVGLDQRVEALSAELAAKRTAAAQLELDAGPQQAGWLEQRIELPPEPEPPRPFTERIGPAVEGVKDSVEYMKGTLDNAKEQANQIAQIGLIVTRLTGTPEVADPAHLQGPVIEQPAPERPSEQPFDLDEAMAKGYRGPKREDIQRAVDEAAKAVADNERAHANAPSSGPTVPDPLAEEHAREQLRMKERHAEELERLEQRHDRLNTEPELLKGYRDRLREQQQEELQLQAERQARERRERLERLEPDLDRER